jgi:membrane protein DedA with SNARE-associated domain
VLDSGGIGGEYPAPMLQRLVDMLSGHGLHFGYAVVFGVLVLCGFGLPMPEDIVLVTGGVLAWMGSDLEQVTISTMLHHPGLHIMVAFGMGGILVGDSVIFWAGRKLGTHVADIPPLRRIITPARLAQAEKLIRRRGNVVVVIARFLPGLRAPTYFTVGHSKLPFWEFLLFDGAAAAVSAPLWVCLGFYFGSNIGEAARHASSFGNYILAGVLVLVAGLGIRWWLRHRDGAPPAPGAPPP